MNEIFTSSKTSEWSTPDWLYKLLDDEFHFQLDAACTNGNYGNQKCLNGLVYYSETDNALTKNWYGLYDIHFGENIPITSIFCNPQYNKLKAWIEKGYEASLHGCTVVFLLPVTKTDQDWWHNIVVPYASEIRFVKGRVKFGGCKDAAPFPSVVVIFKPNKDDWKICSIKRE